MRAASSRGMDGNKLLFKRQCADEADTVGSSSFSLTSSWALSSFCHNYTNFFCCDVERIRWTKDLWNERFHVEENESIK